MVKILARLRAQSRSQRNPRSAWSLLPLVMSVVVHADSLNLGPRLTIPNVAMTAPRAVTIDDVASLRKIDRLSLSPNGEKFAVLVRQGNAETNDYLTGWFVGEVGNDKLTYVGGGGLARPYALPSGTVTGDIYGSDCSWSPDGKWIAYLVRSGEEVQLWRGRVDGGMQEQLTRNAADVLSFKWMADGQGLYFSVGERRVDARERGQRLERGGYSYDEDITAFTDFFRASVVTPAVEPRDTWIVLPGARRERRATEVERQDFERLQRAEYQGLGLWNEALIVSPSVRANGAKAWLGRSNAMSMRLQVTASLSSDVSKPIACSHPECVGPIRRAWWSVDGARVIFWRGEGINDDGQGIYSWSPATDEVTRISFQPDDDLKQCDLAHASWIICIRETKLSPPHLAAIDLSTGSTRVVVDVNPEFRNIRLGRVERFEWDTPGYWWNQPGEKLAGVYPSRAYGYIIYPPDFDPDKVYPAFVDPYIARGFESSIGFEHALHVYAAHGFIVINSEFPTVQDGAERLGAAAHKILYSVDLGFPHLSMLADSTVRAIDTVLARGFVDPRRIGIGGVSHGSFVPLFMMQKYDRIAAISISSPHWGPLQYYWLTGKGRRASAAAYGNTGNDEWAPKPDALGQRFWSGLDIADHVEEIEAPMLMNITAEEAFALLRLIRSMADDGRPYDAYVFRDETHLKWQPAHLKAIMSRNLDWFRYWLQEYEDPALEKAVQYQRWRLLREKRGGINSVSSLGPEHAGG